MSQWFRPAGSTAGDGYDLRIAPGDPGWSHTGLAVTTLGAGVFGWGFWTYYAARETPRPSVASRVLDVLREPYEIGKKTISDISASIGIAVYPEHADEMDSLLSAADDAMYVAKRNGKDQFAVFTPSVQE